MKRRAFIGATLGAALAAPIGWGRLQAQVPRLRFIDCHHHIIPPGYLQDVGTLAIGSPAGRATAPDWSPAMSLDAMDAIGIETAMTSISAPGFPLADPKALTRSVRAVNDYARQLRDDHPRRFGTFAAMPLPDVGAAIAEATHALDVLKADGIGLLTSYAGSYLGDPHFAPFFDALHEHRAVVFVHPTPCTCSAGVVTGVPPAAIEYPHETTRTLTSLLFSGTLDRCPNITFIFSHAGGTLPFIVNRIANRREALVPDPLKSLHRVYHDVAQAVNPVTLQALLGFATAERVVFGSDFSFVSREAVDTAVKTLSTLVPDESSLRRIARENALSFLPRLRA